MRIAGEYTPGVDVENELVAPIGLERKKQKRRIQRQCRASGIYDGARDKSQFREGQINEIGDLFRRVNRERFNFFCASRTVRVVNSAVFSETGVVYVNNNGRLKCRSVANAKKYFTIVRIKC